MGTYSIKKSYHRLYIICRYLTYVYDSTCFLEIFQSGELLKFKLHSWTAAANIIISKTAASNRSSNNGTISVSYLLPHSLLILLITNDEVTIKKIFTSPCVNNNHFRTAAAKQHHWKKSATTQPFLCHTYPPSPVLPRYFFFPADTVTSTNTYMSPWVKDNNSVSGLGFPMVLFNFQTKSTFITSITKRHNKWKIQMFFACRLLFWLNFCELTIFLQTITLIVVEPPIGF